MSTKIFLIGMPGSGKSTLGKELADLLEVDFIDLDKEIENSENRTISELFSREGEDYFRKIENDCLLNVNNSNESFVMATGGGSPCYFEAIQFMINNGKVVFIDVPVEELVIRLKKSQLTDRPLLNTSSLEFTLNETYKKRHGVYQKANFTVFGSEITASEILQMIKN